MVYDYREDVHMYLINHATSLTTGRCTHVSNKPCHSTDYWEDVHMYLINHATALTTVKMLLRGQAQLMYKKDILVTFFNFCYIESSNYWLIQVQLMYTNAH
jgi:hypothetical protein